MNRKLEFKFEVRQSWPNHSFQRTRARGGRGPGPLNSKRWRAGAKGKPMGLDVFVGPLTRYYTGNWETIVQQAAHAQGMDVTVVRPEETADTVSDPIEIREIVVGWREGLSAALGAELHEPLDWVESNNEPYFTDKPAWDCYSSLVLWASYSEQPKLKLPRKPIEDWSEDPAYRASTAEGFDSRYKHLLRDVEFWLPADFEFTFRAPDPSGKEVGFGSSYALLRELDELNAATWQASEEQMERWVHDCPDHGTPIEPGARFAFAVFRRLARESAVHRMPMRLDY